jgi:hypothetical protein
MVLLPLLPLPVKNDSVAAGYSQELSSWSAIGVDGVPAGVSFHVPHKFGVFVLDD